MQYFKEQHTKEAPKQFKKIGKTTQECYGCSLFIHIEKIKTCVVGLLFPEKHPAISTASGVSLFMAMYIGILTPFKLAKAKATFAL